LNLTRPFFTFASRNQLRTINHARLCPLLRGTRRLSEGSGAEKDIYGLSRAAPFSHDHGLVDQIRRAGVSILSNIAKGFERGGNPELIQFLYIAKGSCGEVRAQLLVAADQGYIDSETHTRLAADCRRISAMLNYLIAYLRTSNFQGSKHASPKVPERVRIMLEKYRWKPSQPERLPND
jgi:four helix bundle protein